MFQEGACEAHRAQQSVRAPLHLLCVSSWCFLVWLPVGRPNAKWVLLVFVVSVACHVLASLGPCPGDQGCWSSFRCICVFALRSHACAALEGLVADAAQLMSKADTTDDIQRHAACHPSSESPGLLPVLGQKVTNALFYLVGRPGWAATGPSSNACLGVRASLAMRAHVLATFLAHVFAGLAGSLITRVTGLPVTSSSSEVAPSCCARCVAVFAHCSSPRTRPARRELFALHCLSAVACVLPASVQYGRVHIVMPRPSRCVRVCCMGACMHSWASFVPVCTDRMKPP